MKRMIGVFSLMIIALTFLSLFCGSAEARFRGTIRVTYSVTWNPVGVPSPIGGQVQIVANNTGSPAMFKFALNITGGTVIHFYNSSTWPLVSSSGNNAIWEASSGKWALSQHKHQVFNFAWTGPYSPGFTGNWAAYDKKGNLLVVSSFSWSYP